MQKNLRAFKLWLYTLFTVNKSKLWSKKSKFSAAEAIGSENVSSGPEINMASLNWTKTPAGQHRSRLQALPPSVTNCLPFSLSPVKIWSHIYKRDLFSPTPARYHHSVEKHGENIKGKSVATGERYKQSNDFPRASGVTPNQRKWWHILTQDPGKSNTDILFRTRASHQPITAVNGGAETLWDYTLPEQPRPRGTIYKWTRIKRPTLFSNAAKTKEKRSKDASRWQNALKHAETRDRWARLDQGNV